jgi:hypothetical protein
VPIYADAGFIGRECGSDECGGFFKVHKDYLQPESIVPIAGIDLRRSLS